MGLNPLNLEAKEDKGELGAGLLMKKEKIDVDPKINLDQKLKFDLKKAFGFKEEDQSINHPRFM